MSTFVVGQRWISNTEASLGLGIVVDIEDRRVVISFPAAATERTYSIKDAPLTRITYEVGDSVKDLDGINYEILDKQEVNGLQFYEVESEHGDVSVLPELELDCFVHFNTPIDRLLSGQVDPLKFFDLRYDTAQYQRNYEQSNAMGLMGPRVQLLPHQLYIADQVASRRNPRVLLADEVGLGKTIEAGLILHRQIQTGVAKRALILVPDSLLHQWLVEMLRRFNLRFSVLDEMICTELGYDNENPFEASQLVLCPLSFIVESDERLQQALEAQWDLLLVDEAHHLEWSFDHVSKDYACVERLAEVAQGVLLLTATPEQLGLESHFARLRLLDPDKYFDFDKFVVEQEQYQPVNHLVQKLVDQDINDKLLDELDVFLSRSEFAQVRKLVESGEPEQANDRAINALLDTHGTGRVFFRNTRQAVQGFPKRHLNQYPLDFEESLRIASPVKDWLQIEKVFGSDWLELDQRVQWLQDFLKTHKDEKVLLICSNADTAIELDDHLSVYGGVRSAVFHERMSLVARDRAAAYFADEEDYAQLLICSEIGSEGRNFQFSHHLVMFDLPLNPDLLEQRIGRLDRIGQIHDVQIHVPYYEGTAQEVLLDWYHQGLNAFEETCAIGHPLFETFEPLLMECLETRDQEDVDNLISVTVQRAEQLRDALHEGRDQLIEMNSCRLDEAYEVIDAIQEGENKPLLEDFIERFSDQFGINLETHSWDTIILRPTDHMRMGSLPGLKDEGVTATYSRDIALSREDIALLSWEHPIVKGAMDTVLSTDHGNTAVGTIKLKPIPEGTVMLEALYVVETIAPAELQLNRYLPKTTIRSLVNLDGKDLSKALSHQNVNKVIQRVPLQTAQALAKKAREPIETLVKHAEAKAMEKLPAIIDEARDKMLVKQKEELIRLQSLAEVNSSIRSDEVDYLKIETEQLNAYLEQASIRLDAVRLILAV